MTLRKVVIGKFSIALKAIAIGLPVIIHLPALEKSVAEQPKSPPSKLAQLAYFQGNWVCQVQDVGTADSELAGKMTWSVTAQVGKRSYRIQGTYIRNRERNKKILIQGSMAYDVASDRFVQTVLANDGSKLIFNSVGWQKENFVWQGVQTIQEEDYILRRTITRKSKRTFKAAYAALNPINSQWYSVTNLVCTK
ncbi:hypothetical protein H6F86_12515 [Phormidium sp. FACHB-592]|uniref:DUF1579 domain-containing protein n=1 Tax=Stenomitos frigidus AS-A4 TaxID=2933935 RepID=A0ABV0KIU2_9CYAN|nr:hypothetical protein [Phormidium sp. FACHB-592]MBD2074696.1 hypothetical protein [Phormidium sp. FACHB-592]